MGVQLLFAHTVSTNVFNKKGKNIMEKLEKIKRIVYGKLVDKTITTSFEELSEQIFGEGNCYNESEVRKRMYGMKYLFELMDNENNNVATRILSISDMHVPFNLPIDIFSNYVNKVDILQINGDAMDMFSLSKFNKNFRVSVYY